MIDQCSQLAMTLTITVLFIGATTPAGAEDLRVSCGLSALSELCRLEHVEVTIEQLADRLGDMPERGYSMRQLARAAGHFGLDLHGVRIPPSQDPGLRGYPVKSSLSCKHLWQRTY